MKNLLKNRYFNLDLYLTGILLGVFFEKEEGLVHVFVPFIHIEFKTWSIYKKNRPQTF